MSIICTSCGIGPLSFPSWQETPADPMCPACAYAASLKRNALSGFIVEQNGTTDWDDDTGIVDAHGEPIPFIRRGSGEVVFPLWEDAVLWAMIVTETASDFFDSMNGSGAEMVREVPTNILRVRLDPDEGEHDDETLVLRVDRVAADGFYEEGIIACPSCGSADVSAWADSVAREDEVDHVECNGCGWTTSRPQLPPSSLTKEQIAQMDGETMDDGYWVDGDDLCFMNPNGHIVAIHPDGSVSCCEDDA